MNLRILSDIPNLMRQNFLYITRPEQSSQSTTIQQGANETSVNASNTDWYYALITSSDSDSKTGHLVENSSNATTIHLSLRLQKDLAKAERTRHIEVHGTKVED